MHVVHTDMPQSLACRCIAAVASVLLRVAVRAHSASPSGLQHGVCACVCASGIHFQRRGETLYGGGGEGYLCVSVNGAWQCVRTAHHHLGLQHGVANASAQQALRQSIILEGATFIGGWNAAALLLQHLCCSVCAAARGSACALRINTLACVMVLWMRQCSRQLCIHFKRGANFVSVNDDSV